MKTYLQSLVRHALTAAAGFGAFLASKGLIDPGDVAAVNDGTAQVITGAVVVGGALATRLALTLFGKFLPSSRSENNSGSASGGRALSLLMTLGAAAGFGLFLPSCSSPSDFPVTGSIYYRDPKSGAKGGLTFTSGERPTAYVRVPVYDPETGEQRGEANLSIPIGQPVVPEVDSKSAK